MATERDESASLTTGALLVLATVAVGFVLWFTRSVFIPFVLALFIVASAAPLARRLRFVHQWPTWLALAATYAVVLAIIVIGGAMLVHAGNHLVEVGRSYSYQLLESQETLGEAAPPGSLRERVGRSVQETLDSWGLGDPETIREINLHLAALARRAFRMMLSILSGLILTALFTMFLLAGRIHQEIDSGLYPAIEAQIRRYILTKTAISLLTGALVGVVLASLGVPYAFTFAVLAFVLNYIPSVGSMIATIMPIPAALAAFENDWWVVPVVVIPGVLQFLIGNVVEPKVLGDDLDLHPATVLIALVIWALVWGPVGAILAVPITAAIRISLAQIGPLRPAAELLSGRLAAPERR